MCFILLYLLNIFRLIWHVIILIFKHSNILFFFFLFLLFTQYTHTYYIYQASTPSHTQTLAVTRTLHISFSLSLQIIPPPPLPPPSASYISLQYLSCLSSWHTVLVLNLEYIIVTSVCFRYSHLFTLPVFNFGIQRISSVVSSVSPVSDVKKSGLYGAVTGKYFEMRVGRWLGGFSRVFFLSVMQKSCLYVFTAKIPIKYSYADN